MEPVTTGQIYWGAVPFVVIQVFMVGVVIAFPQMVMHYKGPVVDPTNVQITLPQMPTHRSSLAARTARRAPSGAPQLGAPQLGAPQLGAARAVQPAGD